jgi:hypothetical protein
MTDYGPPYVYRDGQIVSKCVAGPRHVASKAPNVISDTMQPLKHMGTGRVLDSKSQFRRDTIASGCVEVGTDPAALRDRPKIEPRGVREDVQRALAELRSR